MKLSDELKERVQRLAERRQRSVHWLLHEAIAHHVEDEEKRDALDRETRQAWEEYQATGLHVTAEEVERWLASWGTENEPPPPECHT